MIRLSGILLFCVAGLAITVGDATAQLGVIRGRVVEADTDSGLPGATVVISDQDGSQRGTSTDRNGRFEMRQLPPGTYILGVRFVGFKTYADTLSVGLGVVIETVIRLETAERLLDEIIIEDEQRETQVGAGLETIRPAALARVPMPDVTYDLAGYLLTLPGFVSTGDRGGQLFVRGGTPTQNLVLIDGIPIFQPFHIVGFYSAFPADIVSYADVYAGGFGAEYGGRISSVIDISSKNGNKQKVVAAASIAPFLTSVRAEIPLYSNRVSLVTSWRESVIERIAPDLLGRSLPFRFGDRFFKVHAFLSQTSSFSITGLQTFDEGDLRTAGEGEGETGSGQRPAEWKNAAIGSRLTYMPSEYPVVAQFSMYYTRLNSRYQPETRRLQESDIRSMTMSMDFIYLLGTTRIHTSVFGNLHQFVYNLGNKAAEISSGVMSGGMFMATRFELAGKVRIEPSLRFEDFAQGITAYLDPRLRVTMLTGGDRYQWTLAYGKYHQQIVGLNNEQDVSDVFSVWSASPRKRPVPEAEHFLLGVKTRLGQRANVTVEGYRKNLANLSFPVYRDDLEAPQGFARVDGYANGLDIRGEITRRSLFLSVAYSLSDVTYTWSEAAADNPVIGGASTAVAPWGEQFDPPHDRTHQINAMMQLSRGPWRLSMRWQFGSGLPYTRINGFYESLPVQPGDPQGYLDAGGSARLSRGRSLAFRLPPYHRLDLSLERDFRYRAAHATLQMGLVNVYDRSNLFEYNFVTGDRVDQLPLLPSIGLNLGFD